MLSRAPLILLAAALLGASAWVARSVTAVPSVPADAIGAWGFRPGELVHDFRYRAVDGRRGTLAGLLDEHEAVVVAVRTVECPVSKRYGHRLARMEEEYASRGVAFLYLDVSLQDDEEQVARDVDTYGFDGPYVRDPEGRIGRLLQVGVSTEIFVIDRAGTLRYRGAVDDQFGITFSNPRVRNPWLRSALDAVLAAEDVEVDETEASGCFLDIAGSDVPARDLTYHGRISRIVQGNCASCHREGSVAPFSLRSYDQVYGFREMIRWVVTEGRMPPWFASPEHGEWKNDRRLSARDKRDLLAWIDAGAPEGDRADAPLDRAFVAGWQLSREPDTVIRIPEPQDVPAEGVLDYRYVFVKTDFERDRWISEAEIVPTARQATHHVIVYLEGPEDEERGPWLVGTAPGVPPATFPEGAAKRLPAGSWLMFELHYTPNGRATTDETSVGLVFTDGPPRRRVETTAVATTEFEIPPHAANHEVVAERSFRLRGEITAFLPHMHLRGKAFRYELRRSDGTEQILLEVPRYDFNWQLSYEPVEPVRVQPGDVLVGRAWYDNSDANPANPDPSVAVTYGEQSFEEMMFGFFDWIPEPGSRAGARGAEQGEAGS